MAFFSPVFKKIFPNNNNPTFQEVGVVTYSLDDRIVREKIRKVNKSSLQCYSVLSTIAQDLRKMSLKI